MRSESQLYSRYATYVKTLTKIPIVRTYGSTIFTLVMTTIFILFAIKPTVETILVLQKKLTDSNRVLEQLIQKGSDLSLARKNYESLSQDNLSKISSSIPDKPDLKSITQALENSTKKFNASISALQIQPRVFEVSNQNSLGKISEIEFTFNVVGRYPNLISILQDINISSRLISIDKLSFSQLSEGSGLTMSIIGKVYYLK